MPYNLSQDQLNYIQSQTAAREVTGNVARGVDATTARNLTELSANYTGISPGVASSLAQSGVGVSSLGESVWQKELANKMGREAGTTGRKFRNPGRYIDRHSQADFEAMSPADRKSLQKALLNELHDGGGLGVMDTIGDIVSGGYKYTLEPTVDNFIKPYLRESFVVMQAGQEGVAGAARGSWDYLLHGNPLINEARGKADEYEDSTNPLNAITNIPEQTTLYNQIEQQGIAGTLQAEGVGEGFFPDPQSPAMQAAAKAARRYSPYLIGGHAFTPGRALADGIGLEPDTAAFALGSGLVDGAIAWKADPANFALAGMSKVRAARKVIQGDEVYDNLRSEAGIVQGWRKMVGPRRFTDWSKQESAQKVFEKIKEETSATVIHKALGVPVILADELAQADSIEQVTAIIKRSIGGDITSVPKWRGPRFYRNTRALQNTPGNEILFPHNADLSVLADEFDNVMVNAHMPEADRIELLDKLAATTRPVDDVIETTGTIKMGELFDPIERPTYQWGGGGTPREQLTLGDASTKFGGETTKFETTPIRDVAGEAKSPISMADQPSPEFNKLGQRPPTVRERQRAVVDLMFDALGRQLKLHGMPDDIVEEARRVSFESWDDHSQQLIDNLGDPLIDTHGVQIGPDSIDLVHRGDEMTLFDNRIQFPDYHEMRRMTSRIRPLVNHPIVAGTTDVMDILLGVWKTAILTRPATALRVVGEEQIRIAVSGYTSLFNHPMTAIAYALGNPDNRWIEKLAGHTATKPVGNALLNFELKHGYRPYQLGGLSKDDDMFIQAMYKRFEALGRKDRVLKLQSSAMQSVPLNHELAPMAMADEIERLRNSKVALSILKDGPEATRESLKNGVLKNVPLEHADDIDAQTVMRDVLVDAEVDSMNKAITLATKDHPALREAILSGEINGRQIMRFNGRTSRAALREFKGLIDNGDDLPDAFRIDRWRVLDKSGKARAMRGLDNTLDYLMDAVLTRPSNFFSRNVYLQQKYLETLTEAFPYMDRAGRAKIISEVQGANIPKQAAEKFRYMHYRLSTIEDANVAPAKFLTKAEYEARKASGHPASLKPVEHQLDYDTAVFLAKKRAADSTKDLLYDLSKRSQIMDIMRVIFPFGEAFREVTSRWVKLTYENPRVLRRLQQGMMAGREEGSGQAFAPITGVPAQEDTGLFYKDQFGQEVMGIPGGQYLSQATMGMPIPLKGSVQGLNLVGQGIPGTSPLLQIPMSYIVPNKPQWDWFRNMVFPVGMPKGLGMIDKVGRSFVPSWALKIHDGLFLDPEQDRTYASSVKDVMAYLSSTGKYDTQGPNAADEMNRLLDDAMKGAHTYSIVRGLGQMTMPTAPSAEWLAYDKHGRLLLMFAMRNWYNDRVNGNKDKGIESVGYEQAGSDFLDRFGVDNILLSQPKSKALIPAAPISTDGYNWAREHPDLVKKYPTTYGLFAPDSGDFNNAAYQSQLEHHEREDITPEKMLHLANKRLANMVYNRFKIQMGPKFSAPEEDALRELRQKLTMEFPGYGEDPIPFARSEIIINELEKAVQDPALRRTEAGKALNDYLFQRGKALFMFPAGFNSQAAAFVREKLRQDGERLVDKYPSFQPM